MIIKNELDLSKSTLLNDTDSFRVFDVDPQRTVVKSIQKCISQKNASIS